MSINTEILMNFNHRKGLVLIHQQITIVTMEKELETKTQIFGRRSVGKCRCVQQPDTHSFLLWNLGNSIFLAYSLLIRFVVVSQADRHISSSLEL